MLRPDLRGGALGFTDQSAGNDQLGACATRPEEAPAMTLASVGGGAATIGALVQKMPMPPGLGGV